ncbi:hypothetical protein E2R51_17350 [Jeotgalibacillus sp. S-D1]|uniref:hypothetical protein n=1 Tax=Jeotgalibacillus sp. S-D1 TaxID=2552189 RepID=UPI00105A1679|nr:hypothetical protein [Jeotgalibacillus sp. S-D1]TDL30750.1 hypothetical protein E2R51_17350 [Jeotgalibacillus sp. S-D1]
MTYKKHLNLPDHKDRQGGKPPVYPEDYQEDLKPDLKPAEKAGYKTVSYKTTTTISGPAESVNNIIFDADHAILPLVLAGTIVNFSSDGIYVTFHKADSQETIPVQGNASLTFIYEDVVRITLEDFGQDFMGSFKLHAQYTCKE